MKDRFKNKVVLITGSSSGIGRGAALTFAAQGAKVVLASRSERSNQEVLKEIRGNGGSAIFVKADMTVTADIANMVKRAVAEYGRLDIAVNNAGVEGTPDVRTADYDEQVWDQVIDVNLKGVWLSMKYEIPELLKGDGGVIINISSLAGLQAGGAGIGYHASKFGVVGMTKATALEYAKDKLRVNTVCPAVIETPMAERAFDTDEKRNNAIDFHPVGRFGTVNEVVSTICWLASDAASFITGAAVPVDGGANL